MLTYIQIYNLKRSFECKCKKIMWQNNGPATHYFFVALSFRRFMRNNPVHIIGIERSRPQSDSNKIKKMIKDKICVVGLHDLLFSGRIHAVPVPSFYYEHRSVKIPIPRRCATASVTRNVICRRYTHITRVKITRVITMLT